MGYINDSLKRANLKELGNHLLYGGIPKEYDGESYEERLKKAYRRCLETVTKFDRSGEDSILFKDIDFLISEYQETYMELGIRTGFLLAKDIFDTKTLKESTETIYEEMYKSLFNEMSRIIQDLQTAQQKVEDIYMKA